MIRCAIYTRSNVAAGNNADLHRLQQTAIRSLIARNGKHGWKCVATYQDTGQSAGTLIDVDVGGTITAMEEDRNRFNRGFPYACPNHRTLQKP